MTGGDAVRLPPDVERRALDLHEPRTNPPRADRLAVVTVPVPPSVNALYRNGRGGRYKTRAYKAWLTAVGDTFRALAPPDRLPVEIWIVVRGKLRGCRDVENCSKAICDQVVATGTIPDDSVPYVVGTHQLYRPDGGEPRADVSFARPADG